MIQDNKVIYVLESFTKVELNRFLRYLQSPYFNQHETSIKLFELLLPALKDKSSYPDKKELYKRLFKTAYVDLKYRRAMSDLLALAEDFISMEKRRSEPTDAYTDLLTGINTRGLVKLFNGNYDTAIKKQAKIKVKDAAYYLTEFQLHVELNQHLELQKKRTEQKNLEAVMESLDTFYIINKLRYACAVEHYRNVLHITIRASLVPEVLELAGKAPYSEIPAILVYKAIYQMLTDKDGEEFFKSLREIIRSYETEVPQAIERDAYVFAINFCVRQINKGKLEYLREVFDLYNVALEKSILFDKDEFSPWDYKNLVTLGLRLKENKWTETFIAEYKNRIPLSERTNAYTFNLAKFYFYTRKYDEVLQLLQDVKYDDMFYLLDSKTLLVKTYYEKGEYELLYSLISSFRALLRRKRSISDTHRKNYSNLLQFISQLSRIDVRDKKALEGLKVDFQRSSNIADAGWLREKMQELGISFETD